MISENKTVLFLIRKNPDTIGGIQRHNARLLAGISGSFQIEPIIWRGPEWGAPFYFPLFYYKTARNGADLIHCDDAVTAIIGSTLKRNTGKKAVATVHGLDVILPIQRYQKAVSRALSSLNRVICVSEATARKVETRGVSRDKIEVIPNSAEKVPAILSKNDELLAKIRNLTGIGLQNKKVLFSLGRPLRRKGFDYFIRNVFAHLPEDFVYIVAGPPQKLPSWLKSVKPFLKNDTYRKLLIASGCDSISPELEKLSELPRVHYLKTVSEDLRELLFAASDLFIMPNRTVDGDMEGFGIVALEAAARGIPVVATGIEGITDAVIHGENGFCIDEKDDAAMIKTIIALTDDTDSLKAFGEKARAFTEKRFAPDTVYSRYEKIFEELLGGSRN
ncbi:MAG: glycosyltransferase family 4 protein [Candidatus Zixiibacteriota bacterium]|nr:MAG: glycosyltransferase family 4 protein [candidate division Zixibacteria bacterium]